MKARLSIAAALVATMMATLAAWQERPVFRAEVNYVEVTARVVDKTGRFIDGLTAKDFSVAEDRRVEPVHQVIRVSLPTPWNNSASAPPVLYRPDLPREQRIAEGRIYLLYLNSIDVAHVPVTRQLAKDFVNRYVLIDDVVAVWSAFGAVRFTSDKLLLSRRIDEFLGSVETYGGPLPRAAGPGEMHGDLTSALQWFSSVQGRKKSVLLFSAGWSGIAPVFSDRQTPAPFTSNLLDRADIQIYAIDTRGLVANVYRSTAGANAAAAAASITTQAEAVFTSLNNMKWLAEDTGGFAIINHNAYDEHFRRIVDENSEYYVIGYSSSRKVGQAWDYREITLKLTNPAYKDARIFARRGYIARR